MMILMERYFTCLILNTCTVYVHQAQQNGLLCALTIPYVVVIKVVLLVH